MVNKLIVWIVSLLRRHGYRVSTEEEHEQMCIMRANEKALFSGQCEALAQRITALEQWQQQADTRIKEQTSTSEIISEWLNGEAASGDRS